MKYPADFTEDHRKQGICGVLAIAVAAGVTLAEAHAACKRNMDPGQTRHVRSTSTRQIEACLREFGKDVVKYDSERMTIARWAREFGGRNALVFTSGHVMVYRDGLLLDQGEVGEAVTHRNKRCFVKQVMEIF